MIGVVVWSDFDQTKAIIWCEDQGDLAYYLPGHACTGISCLSRGDIVEFDDCQEGALRVARNVTVVEHKPNSDLVGILDDIGVGTRQDTRPKWTKSCKVTRLPVSERPAKQGTLLSECVADILDFPVRRPAV